jgi:hypothetical protein
MDCNMPSTISALDKMSYGDEQGHFHSRSPMFWKPCLPQQHWPTRGWWVKSCVNRSKHLKLTTPAPGKSCLNVAQLQWQSNTGHHSSTFDVQQTVSLMVLEMCLYLTLSTVLHISCLSLKVDSQWCVYTNLQQLPITRFPDHEGRPKTLDFCSKLIQLITREDLSLLLVMLKALSLVSSGSHAQARPCCFNSPYC